MKIIFALIAIWLAAPLYATNHGAYGQIRLIDGGRDDQGVQWIGLEFNLNEGWKTYWRLAGQNGLDPLFDFSGSTNLDTTEFYWPEPHLLGTDLPSIGYSESFILPIAITPQDAQHPQITLSLFADIGVCSDVCVPIALEFSQPLKDGFTPDIFKVKPHNADQLNHTNEAIICNWPAITSTGWVLIEQNNTAILQNNAAKEGTKTALYDVTQTGITPRECP